MKDEKTIYYAIENIITLWSGSSPLTSTKDPVVDSTYRLLGRSEQNEECIECTDSDQLTEYQDTHSAHKGDSTLKNAVIILA